MEDGRRETGDGRRETGDGRREKRYHTVQQGGSSYRFGSDDRGRGVPHHMNGVFAVEDDDVVAAFAAVVVAAFAEATSFLLAPKMKSRNGVAREERNDESDVGTSDDRCSTLNCASRIKTITMTMTKAVMRAVWLLKTDGALGSRGEDPGVVSSSDGWCFGDGAGDGVRVWGVGGCRSNVDKSMYEFEFLPGEIVTCSLEFSKFRMAAGCRSKIERRDVTVLARLIPSTMHVSALGCVCGALPELYTLYGMQIWIRGSLLRRVGRGLRCPTLAFREAGVRVLGPARRKGELVGATGRKWESGYFECFLIWWMLVGILSNLGLFRVVGL
ncbi:uncharacterized protein EI97DRAFT_323412 [Westerdykella ornata]|uniref:Uncharacterized protein n=1 Tax=Westerdykella ornata TaxID=318751 RepID=A0A6A6JK08_WESOR|nr:uncharacterized protein EI97DRAFT_323412 [Westerdykella ornata]KAF2276837.1 hypothetical protein EI97DRAFT_323412 [Westerdykella ornata]